MFFNTNCLLSGVCAISPDFADIYGQVTQLILGQKLHAAPKTESENRDCEILGRTGSCEKCGKGKRGEDCIWRRRGRVHLEPVFSESGESKSSLLSFDGKYWEH